MNSFKKHKILSLSLILFILAGCGATSADLSKIQNSGMISVAESPSYDWGDISIQRGKVKKTFALENKEQEDLILKYAQTSCMCTTIQFKTADGKFSPEFGMHNNGFSWLYAVKPGEKFEAEVIFDPMAHGPDAVGPIQRSIFVLSSSKSNEFTQTDPKTGDNVFKLDLKANVLSEENYKEKYEQNAGV